MEGESHVNVNLQFPFLRLPEENLPSTGHEAVSVSEDVDMYSPREQNGSSNHGNPMGNKRAKITFKALSVDGADDIPTDRVVSRDYFDPEDSIVACPSPPRQRRKLVHFA